MQHLISIDDLSVSEVERIFDIAEKCLLSNHKSTKVESKKFINLFFENSTRTSLSFKIAASELGGKLFDLSIQNSSTAKGESFIDTISTVASMKPDFLIIRHDKSGACHIAKKIIEGKNITIINAGDGINEHPTQALIDLFTIRKSSNKKNLKVAICGDIVHSRVAHSDIKLFERFGFEVSLVAPPTLLPNIFLNNKIYYNICDVLSNVDAIILLRLQHERIRNSFVPSKEEYYKLYGLDKTKLQKSMNKDLIIMHPGPINRGIEISSDVVDLSLIHKQVEYGVAVRKGIFEFLSALR